MALIEVRDISKNYKIKVGKKGLLGTLSGVIKPEYRIKNAVKSINFSIEKGEMVGFIGPNGAGKSTTVKMLTGILVPTAGNITVGGLSPCKDRKKHAARIGVVFGQRTQLWWDLPVIETLDLLKDIYEIPDAVYKKNMEVFTDILGLDEFLSQTVRQLSLGQRMRADIAAALLHNPEIVFFDEPTIGLDIVAKEKIREFIKFINKEYGITMLLTTHDMADVEKVCRRMIIIDHGTIIYDGTIENIKRLYGQERTLVVEFGRKYDVGMDGVEVVNVNDLTKKFVFNKDEVQVTNLISELTSRYEVSDLTINEPQIEGIIREIYKGGITLEKGVC